MVVDVVVVVEAVVVVVVVGAAVVGAAVVGAAVVGAAVVVEVAMRCSSGHQRLEPRLAVGVGPQGRLIHHAGLGHVEGGLQRLHRRLQLR